MSTDCRAPTPKLTDLDVGLRLSACDALEQRGTTGLGVTARLLPEYYGAQEEERHIEPANDVEVVAALARIAGVCPASFTIAEALGFSLLTAQEAGITTPNSAGVQQALF